MFNLVSLNTIRKSPLVACACESFLRESSPLYKKPRASKLVLENRFETVRLARLLPTSEKLHFLLVFVSNATSVRKIERCWINIPFLSFLLERITIGDTKCLPEHSSIRCLFSLSILSCRLMGIIRSFCCIGFNTSKKPACTLALCMHPILEGNFKNNSQKNDLLLILGACVFFWYCHHSTPLKQLQTKAFHQVAPKDWLMIFCDNRNLLLRGLPI